MTDGPLKVRFDLPRPELERAARDWARKGAEAERSPRFDSTHLLGRLYVDIGVPLADDPVLGFLRQKRGLNVDPPFTVALDQPLGHAIGGLSSFAVLALHGEGSFMLPLSGDRGALGVDLEDGDLQLSVPLDRYAGVAPVPAAAAAAAVAAAARDLAKLVSKEQPSLSSWPLLAALQRDANILRALSERGPPSFEAPLPAGSEDSFSLDECAGGRGLVQTLTQAEEAGAHVVPYWRVESADGGRAFRFEPLRPARVARTRGSLARLLLPQGERALHAQWPGDPRDDERLRQRLRRPLAFGAAVAEGGRRLELREARGPLPMA